MPSFGTWIGAATIVIIGVALLEQYDIRLAWGFAFLILMAVFFRYPAALGEIQRMFNYRPER
jgi:hypothetical protein